MGDILWTDGASATVNPIHMETDPAPVEVTDVRLPIRTVLLVLYPRTTGTNSSVLNAKQQI